MSIFGIIRTAYSPYSIKLRLSLSLYIYFVIILFTRLCGHSLGYSIFILFFSVLFLFLTVPFNPLCKIIDFYCVLFYNFCIFGISRTDILVKTLNLCFNLRAVLTRGYPSVLFFYNIFIIFLFFLQVPNISIIRIFLSLVFLLGSIIDILYQCFLFYTCFGLLEDKGQSYINTDLYWRNNQSLFLQVKYNRMILRSIQFLFLPQNIKIYSREILMFGFRPACKLDRLLRLVVSKFKIF